MRWYLVSAMVLRDRCGVVEWPQENREKFSFFCSCLWEVEISVVVRGGVECVFWYWFQVVRLYIRTRRCMVPRSGQVVYAVGVEQRVKWTSDHIF